jgi:hypothetical protein
MRLLVSRRSHPSECESCGPTSQPRRCLHLLSGVRTRPHWPSHRSCRRRRRAQHEPVRGRARERHPLHSGAARVASALAGAETLLLSSGVAEEGAPTRRRARSPAVRPRGVRVSACGPGRRGRRRHTRRRVVSRIPGRLPQPSRRAGVDRAPSRRPRPGVADRRTPAQPGHARRRAAAPRTLHSDVLAKPSVRRSARRAAARCGAAPRCSDRRPALPEESRRDSAEAEADRARHHARAACVTCQCQLGEYSARSGRPRRRRIRLSASSSWSTSPMSNHWPSKRYA